MYWPAITFIAACLVYAAYSFLSIRGLTGGWLWHLCQWVAAFVYIITGFLFGRWWKNKFNFHDLGRIVGLAVVGITVYVYVLHYLLARF